MSRENLKADAAVARLDRGRSPAAGRRRRGFSGRLCALVLCALWGGGLRVLAFPGAPAPEFELRAAVQVDSSGVYLHQILSAPLSALPPQSIRLTAAPAFGQTVSISRAQLRALLAAAAPGLTITNWSGAEAVQVTRRSRALAEGELRELLTATLQREAVKDRGDLELRLSRPWAPMAVPDESLVLKVLDLPTAGVSPNFIVRFELMAGSDRLGPWQVVLQARVLKEVLIARAALRRGQALADGDFIAERRDVLTLREPLDPVVLRNPSLEVVEGVVAGQPLLARSVRMKPVVQRGQMVDGLIREGALQINLRVEVLVDGLPGQLVRVRNPKTKREFYAKVQDDQTVLINL